MSNIFSSFFLPSSLTLFFLFLLLLRRFMKTVVHFETRVELENGGVSEAKYTSTVLPLTWGPITRDCSQALQEAKEQSSKYLSTHQLALLRFESFGKVLLKALKVSPDSFVQMALQLAFYRDQQKFTSTYETGTTRGFYHVSENSFFFFFLLLCCFSF